MEPFPELSPEDALVLLQRFVAPEALERVQQAQSGMNQLLPCVDPSKITLDDVKEKKDLARACTEARLYAPPEVAVLTTAFMTLDAKCQHKSSRPRKAGPKPPLIPI